jgi:hypothetical protein
MTPTLHGRPAPATVLREQLRSVALALRLPALAFAALVAVATVIIVVGFLQDRRGLDFEPELSPLTSVVGLLLPIGVWLGEDRFGTGFLWTLPVERRWHALARVGSGWLVLMAIIAGFVAWQAVITLLTGGGFLADRTLQLVLADPSVGTVGPDALRQVRWTPEPLLWLAPFTGATGTYLLASAVALGVRRPVRRFAAIAAALFVLGALADVVGRAIGSDWLVLAPARVMRAVLYGPFGFDTLSSARTESLKTLATLANGDRVSVWTGLPDVGQWALATGVWIAAGALALLAAASRHRERRGA